jgi:hypothetical protein
MQAMNLVTTREMGSHDYEREREFQFYPTPREVISQLIAPYSHRYATVLEPSAGRGDIADALKNWRNLEVKCCEISADLRAILISKGHRVIGTDFLTLEAPYQFGLVIMNPPFAGCADHVVKAWNMLQPGSELAAIIPESAIGKGTGKYPELNKLIDLYGKTEPIGAAFSTAERKTHVKCVIIRLKRPEAKKFNPFENFEPKTDEEYTEPDKQELPAPRDMVRAIVAQYQAAMRALKVAHEAEMHFRALVPDSSIKYEPANTYTERIDRTKKAFWDLIFERTKIGEVTTSGFRKDFMAARERLSQMEFSEQTIYEVLHHFMQNKDQILGECIMDVFKQVTNFSRDNVVRHEQWATNKSWKIGTKIIVPYSLDVYFDWQLSSRREDFLNDLDKAITMFGGTNGICTIASIKAVLERIRSKEIPYTGKFETPNFHFRVYKKGTLHLWFRDPKALEMMNRYAAEREMFTLGSGK